MLISELEFGSFLTYCSSKEDVTNADMIKKSKNVMYNIKLEKKLPGTDTFASEYVAERIKENLNSFPFKDFFEESTALVPIPKSSLIRSDSLWVSDKIARALENKGLGFHYPCLERINAVPKSAYSKSSERPKPIDHFNSLKVNPSIHQPKEIILIDDIITRGATMLACASLLKKNFPNSSIRGFAVIRTISDATEFHSISNPCVGKITLSNGETYRNP